MTSVIMTIYDIEYGLRAALNSKESFECLIIRIISILTGALNRVLYSRRFFDHVLGVENGIMVGVRRSEINLLRYFLDFSVTE